MTTNLTALYGLGGGGSGKWKSQTFTASGLWQRPANVEVVKVILVGGGGGGGGRTFDYSDGVNLAKGKDGGNSTFAAQTPTSIVAYGGKGGGPYPAGGWNPAYGGDGGGSSLLYPEAMAVAGDYGGFAITGNGAYYDRNSFFRKALSGVSFGDSISGGGGSVGSGGGNVVGFGKGGTGAGGGGSFGDGGNGSSNGGLTAATSGIFGGGGGGFASGGGGGEIVIRMVPVISDVVVTIGAGGAGGVIINDFYNNLPDGAKGGNGLCIVFWQE